MTETFIMVLVLSDAIFALVEAGVQHHVVCTGGHLVASPTQHAGITSFREDVDDFSMVSRDVPEMTRFRSERGPLDGGSAGEDLRRLRPDGPEAQSVKNFCHTANVVILCVFIVELSLKLWADPSQFLASTLHKFDLFVVSISLLLDTAVLAFLKTDDQREAIELVTASLILTRSWRVVRIFRGFIDSGGTSTEELELQAEVMRLRCTIKKLGYDADL
eukprot:CAMPEP_0168492776 /NCGR_PEP_ID=MMETSP0228-20121227/70387_1 /TAXON_ID=133427 /ORGANISM="Protoceratium reticulatum, Strain CCCM 535 (=CCMP 1889)" /LENGTH=217 /DNA_ID=CAMNT_0008509557 /DNA_START=112 /DNA_END=765 /DNA_ORIENTATION=+